MSSSGLTPSHTHVNIFPYISNCQFEHNERCKRLSKNTLIYFQNFMNMARGMQTSDITKENKLSTGPFHIRAVQYNIYSLNVMARDENVWPTSTLPRLGRMLWCDIINLTLHRHAIFYKLTLLTKAWYRFKFIDTIMIDNILSHEWKRFIYLQIKMQSI